MRTLFAASLCALLPAAAGAHHSSAAFDLQSRATLTGTVKMFQWENPHCWLVLSVPDGKGGTQDWSLEGGSVSILVRNGWRANSVAVGDKVKVLIALKRDKSPGGEFFTVLERNGAKFAPVAS